MLKLFLVGNYGVGNIGDELLKEYFLRTFPPVQWVVAEASREACFSSCPYLSVPRIPLGFRSFLFTPWWRTLRELQSSQAIVFGGGTLFADHESRLAPILWWWNAFVAWCFRKPIILAFQGFGPLHFSLSRWCTAWVVRRAACIIVRDEASAGIVRTWTKNAVVLAHDPVLLLLHRIGATHVSREQRTSVIIPRGNSTQDFLDHCRSLAETSHRGSVRIVSFSPHDPQEQTLCRRLASMFMTHVIEVRSPQDVLDALHGASHVLTQRYHGAIGALALGIPFTVIPQQKGDKLSRMVSDDLSSSLQLLKHAEALLKQVFSELHLQ